MKKLLIATLKVLASIAIVAWLFWDALHRNPEAVAQLRDGAKNWGYLSAALLICSSTVVLVTVRWYFLIRTVGIDCRLRDVFRISLIGYLFNLAPMGIVGGDLLKAWMLAHEKGHRAEAVASVIIDRVIGLYILFVVAAAAILGTGFGQDANADVRYISRATLVLTAVGTVALMALFAPERWVGHFVRWCGKIPGVGRPLEQLLIAVRLYRHHRFVLLVASLMSVAVHSTFILGIHWISLGLPGPSLTFQQHCVVAPLSAATNVIPLPAGPQEGAMKFLYDALATAPQKDTAPLKGLAISLAYRLITVLIAAVGMGYYLSSRREVADVLHEEESAPQSPVGT